MIVWYLAHPVAPDDKYTMEQNLEHALKVQKILWEMDIATIMPWYSYVMAYGAGDGEQLKKCLDLDQRIVVLTGRIILTGHKVSRGMQIEVDALKKFHAGYAKQHMVSVESRIIDATGLPDDKLAQYMNQRLPLHR